MLTEKQTKAYDLICQAKEGISKIEGYAGTGKSFVLSMAAKELGNQCIVLTPTNKAAQVLRDKGIKASTLHSVLYSPRNTYKFLKKDNKIEYHKDANGDYILDCHGEKIPVVESEELSFDFCANPDELAGKIAIIDEASMLKEQEFTDIKNTFSKVILIGDGMQLPPIKSKDIFRETKTDIFLDEVHRVAQENPIINLATHIRQGGRNFKQFEDGKNLIVGNKFHDEVVNNSQNYTHICYNNNLRRNINARIRKKLGYTEPRLYEGEPIISLSNVRNDSRKIIAFNGEIFSAVESLDVSQELVGMSIMTVKRATGNKSSFNTFKFWRDGFWQYHDSPKFEQDFVSLWKVLPSKADINLFDFAYCLTAHKAQGSEFDATMVWDQSSNVRGTTEDQTRWLYTATTRSKEKLFLIK